MNTASGVLAIVGFFPYIWAILHHQTVPSPVTWAIWAGIDMLTLLAMKKEKALNGQIIGSVIGALIVLIFAFIFGKPTMGSIEWVSIIGATAGIVLWQKTGNAVLAIICCQVALLAGAIPTFIGGYQYPAQEDPIAWSIWWVSCVCALLAIRKWDLANALQPLTFTVIETTMVLLVVIRPLWL